MKNKIKVAIVGVGNCASSLVQGVHFYRNAQAGDRIPGLMNVVLGNYHVGDIKFVLGIDVDTRKTGRDLSQAILAAPNNTVNFCKVPHLRCPVIKGPVLDGVGKYLEGVVLCGDNPLKVTRDNRRALINSFARNLEESGAQVLVNFLPVGSQKAVEFYAEVALSAKVAFVNCMPVFIASNRTWAQRFMAAGVPVLGDDVKSQVGATIVHRALASLFVDRGVKVDKTYQLNFGGNTDFLNMLERDRLESKKISKTGAVTSMLPYPMAQGDVHVGPSDHVPFLQDRKFCHIRIEGTTFGNVPLLAEVKLEVWDSPNSAGVVIDAIRCAAIALRRGIGGAIHSPSSYFFKTPPVQYTDDVCKQNVRDFINRRLTR